MILRRHRRQRSPRPTASAARVGSFLPCIVLLLLLSAPLADGFAAWLVTKATGCWTDLDVSDVIMNANPKPPSDSAHPGVAVRAYYEAGGAVESRSGIIALSRDNNRKENEPWEFALRLEIPLESRAALADVQFVMSVADGSGETSSGGKFSGPSSGCGGGRAHGRGKDTDGLPFRIEPDAFDEKFGENGKSLGIQSVQVWAGWATDHAAVQLTERLTFTLPEGAEDDENGGGNKAGEPGNKDAAVKNEGGDAADENRPKAEIVEDDSKHQPAKGRGSGSRKRKASGEDMVGMEKVKAKIDKAKKEKIAGALDRMADFRRAGALQHHGIDDPSREEIIRDQMGRAKKGADANWDAVRDNVKKVGDMMEKQRMDGAEGALGGEWDAEKVREGLTKMASDRAKAMKKKREEKRQRYGPGGERKKERAGQFDDDYAAAEREREEAGLSAMKRFQLRYERDDFGGAGSFNVRGYIIGMLLMFFFVLGLTRYARVADRRWNKGTRIL